jgi:hypothetical protein
MKKIKYHTRESWKKDVTTHIIDCIPGVSQVNSHMEYSNRNEQAVSQGIGNSYAPIYRKAKIINGISGAFDLVAVGLAATGNYYISFVVGGVNWFIAKHLNYDENTDKTRDGYKTFDDDGKLITMRPEIQETEYPPIFKFFKRSKKSTKT